MDLRPFTPTNDKQRVFYSLLEDYPVVLCNGCAGTGKTLVALWYGLTQVARGNFDRVIYVRSDVGVKYQRGRGALPGDLDEKMAPLLGPIYDNLSVITANTGFIDYLFRKKIISPILLEDIRGRSFNNSFILVDECQNFLVDHCKTVLTRLGKGSQMCMVGDTRQVDLHGIREPNGLYDAIERIGNLDNVATIQFTADDITRHGIVAQILKRYER